MKIYFLVWFMNIIYYYCKILNINLLNINYINILCLKVMFLIVLGYMKNDLKKNW